MLTISQAWQEEVRMVETEMEGHQQLSLSIIVTSYLDRSGSSVLLVMAPGSVRMLNAVVVDGIILEIKQQPAQCVMALANVQHVLVREVNM